MAEVTVERELDASADAVWALLSKFGGIAEWNAGMESCTTEGEGVGAVRTITMPGGLQIQERLESHDEAARTYSYAIIGEGPLPFTDYLSTVTVAEAGDGACRVTWRGQFQPKGDDESGPAGIIHGIYSGGLAAAGKHLGVSVREV